MKGKSNMTNLLKGLKEQLNPERRWGGKPFVSLTKNCPCNKCDIQKQYEERSRYYDPCDDLGELCRGCIKHFNWLLDCNSKLRWYEEKDEALNNNQNERRTKITILEYPTDEDWIAVKQRALVTVGLKAKTPPTNEWKYSILKARHSPIRRLRFSVLFEDIPNWVAVHLVRHVHSQPYVKSQRNDRQSDYDRNKAPQNTPVNMIWDFNGEELMNIANKRLCKQAAKETREIIKDMCDKIIELDNIWTDFLVPMCKYVGECKEMFPCYLKENKND